MSSLPDMPKGGEPEPLRLVEVDDATTDLTAEVLEYLGWAKVHTDTGQFDLAAADYSRALTIQPEGVKTAEMLLKRAEIYQSTDRLGLAFVDTRDAVSILGVFPEENAELHRLANEALARRQKIVDGLAETWPRLDPIEQITLH
jgi:tetratricopeptide (TPR) repeat protein